MGRATDDPLALAIAPPHDETPAQREAREAAEIEAKRISDAIDEQIRRQKEVARKKKKPLKLLLLGQSESGKSATLKNFQLTFANREWTAERASWRSVIQLNLVRNVNDIMDHLAREMSSVSFPSMDSDYSSDDLELIDAKNTPSLAPLSFTEKHRLLKLRLAPLRRIQAEFEQRLGTASSEVYSTDVTTASPFDNRSGRKAIREFSITSRNGWKSALEKCRTSQPPRRSRTSRPGSGLLKRTHDVDEEATEVIASCREDMIAIWMDPLIRDMLNRRNVRIEDSPGFFLDQAERIAVSNYAPSDDDVIRARLRTLGVQEYRFVFEQGRSIGQEWLLYDVGGTRSSRAAWYPYFDDVDAILFLAPISCFNENLTEDRRVNRLEDSYHLWKSLCSSKLLARTQFILFLNKCDLLQKKLQRGVKIKNNIPSYATRKNDLNTAAKYFGQHFREISKKYCPIPKPFYVHLTSVIDIRSTADTLATVEESILSNYLHHAQLT